MRRLGALVLLALAACGRPPESSDLWEISTIRRAKERGTLLVATEPEFPPFESIDEKGNLVGFDIDLAREIGRELGVEVKFQKVAFETIFQELLSGRVDLVVSGVTTTADRGLTMSFTQPYFETVTCLLVSKERGSDVKGVEDLNRDGRIVAVKIGTTGVTAANRHCPKAKIVTFPTETAAALEVAQGKADAFLYDLAPVRRHHAENPDSTFTIEDPISLEPYAIACRKGDPETVAWLDLVLSLMRRDGRMQELYARHGLETPRRER